MKSYRRSSPPFCPSVQPHGSVYPNISPVMISTPAGFPRLARSLEPSSSSAGPPFARAETPAPVVRPSAAEGEAGEELVGFDDVHPTYPSTATDKARAAQGRRSIRAIVDSLL